jgi:ribosome biogenesis GTPase
MCSFPCSLHQLGWRPFFAQQLTLDDLEVGFPARVAVVHRTVLTVITESGELQIPAAPGAMDLAVTVGDWVLLEHRTERPLRRLERYSSIVRLAAGREPRPQAIAANLDTLFIVMSCNADFNPSRLERYLAVAFESQAVPVIVLTKADLSGDDASFITEAQRVAPSACVIALNATDGASTRSALQCWLGEGQTVVFVGSSGVGKSTLCNALLGRDSQATAAIREDDAKGRHTTTARFLLRTPAGAWIIDTPGMRELKIGAATAGVAQTFADVESLTTLCRFRDCGHQADEGCAVRAAVADGRLALRRLESYLKLAREAERASRTPWERHQQERRFGRMAREAQRGRGKKRGAD